MRGMLEGFIDEKACINLRELRLTNKKLKINKVWILISLVFMAGILLICTLTGSTVAAFISVFTVIAVFLLVLNRLQLLGKRKSLQE